MDNARSFIYIAVMNYLPTMEFSHPRRYSWERGQGPGQGAAEQKRSGRQSDDTESRRWGHSKGTERKLWGELEVTKGTGEQVLGAPDRGKGDRRMRIWGLQGRDGRLEG